MATDISDWERRTREALGLETVWLVHEPRKRNYLSLNPPNETRLAVTKIRNPNVITDFDAFELVVAALGKRDLNFEVDPADCQARINDITGHGQGRWVIGGDTWREAVCRAVLTIS